MKPKKWMKKYCKEGYVICDGMTGAELGFWETWLLPIALGGFFISWICLKVYQYIRINKEVKK